MFAIRCLAWLKNTKSASMYIDRAGTTFPSLGRPPLFGWHSLQVVTSGKLARSPVLAVVWQYAQSSFNRACRLWLKATSAWRVKAKQRQPAN